MKFLHTADWHIGKTLKGISRAEEFRAVLKEIEDIAIQEKVDFIIVAGDLFDKAAPNPESEDIVYTALANLGKIAPVFGVTGNHDNPKRFQAIAPLLRQSNVRFVNQVLRPNEGGVMETKIKGVGLKIAALPFVTKRGIIKIEDLDGEKEEFQNMQKYAERLARIIGALSKNMDSSSVNLFCGHLFVAGGVLGGGERNAHTILDYAVSSLAFPANLQYVALGHLHRSQKINGKCPIHYSGSIVPLDFGEEKDEKFVKIVEVEPGLPAKIKEVKLNKGRSLKTIKGSLEELQNFEETFDENTFLRIRVNEPRRPGLSEEVKDIFGEQAINIEIISTEVNPKINKPSRRGKLPIELFSEYCTDKKIKDPAVIDAFKELLGEVKL